MGFGSLGAASNHAKKERMVAFGAAVLNRNVTQSLGRKWRKSGLIRLLLRRPKN